MSAVYHHMHNQTCLKKIVIAHSWTCSHIKADQNKYMQLRSPYTNRIRNRHCIYVAAHLPAEFLTSVVYLFISYYTKDNCCFFYKTGDGIIWYISNEHCFLPSVSAPVKTASAGVHQPPKAVSCEVSPTRKGQTHQALNPGACPERTATCSAEAHLGHLPWARGMHCSKGKQILAAALPHFAYTSLTLPV